MSEELKTCPFCGGKAVFNKYHTVDKAQFWFVQCCECGASSWYSDTQEKIAIAWNTRDNFIRKIKRNVKGLVKQMAKALLARVEGKENGHD